MNVGIVLEYVSSHSRVITRPGKVKGRCIKEDRKEGSCIGDGGQ